MIDAGIIADVRHVAARVSQRLDSSVYSREDLQQDLLLQVLERAPKYDSGRASARTWAAVIVRHEAATLIEQARAEKRDCRLCTRSLNEPVMVGQAGAALELQSILSMDAYNLKTGRQSRSAEELLNLRVDVKCALARVRPDVAQFAMLLTHETVSSAARSTGISHATAYRRVRELRAAFTLHGLDRYVFGVRKGPQTHQRGRHGRANSGMV